MPSNRKVYQKKAAVKRKISFLKFFFCPLYAISRHFNSRYGPSQNSYPARMPSAIRACLSNSRHARIFSFKSLWGIGQPRDGNRAPQGGSRQGRGLILHAAPCFVALLLLTGCQTSSQKESLPQKQSLPQRKSLTDLEEKRLRQEILFKLYNAWRLKKDEREFLNTEKGIEVENGTENISNKKSGPGSSTR